MKVVVVVVVVVVVLSINRREVVVVVHRIALALHGIALHCVAFAKRCRFGRVLASSWNSSF